MTKQSLDASNMCKDLLIEVNVAKLTKVAQNIFKKFL